MGKITAQTADASPTSDDLLVTVNDPAGTPVNRKVAIDDLDDYLSASTKTLTNKTISAAIFTGTLDMTTANTLIEWDPSLSADTDHIGFVISGTTGATVAVGDLIYQASTTWSLTDADAESTSGPVLIGISLFAGTSGLILLRGLIRSTTFGSGTQGNEMYLSTTAGDATATAPSGTGDVVRCIGHFIDANTFYFNPSSSYLVLS